MEVRLHGLSVTYLRRFRRDPGCQLYSAFASRPAVDCTPGVCPLDSSVVTFQPDILLLVPPTMYCWYIWDPYSFPSCPWGPVIHTMPAGKTHEFRFQRKNVPASLGPAPSHRGDRAPIIPWHIVYTPPSPNEDFLYFSTRALFSPRGGDLFFL